MNVITTVNIDLQVPLPVQTVDAKQYDTARWIAFNLYNGGAEYNIPAGTYGAFRCSKPDGTYCFYDSANGQNAVQIYANTVTVLLADQVLTADGIVNCEVSLYNGAGERVTSFNVNIDVQESVLPDPMISESYVSFLTELAQQILSAGITVVPLGFYPTLAALEAGVPDPQPGDIYGVGASEPYDFYIFDIVSGAWVDAGTMAGPQGEPGEQGVPGVGIPTGGAVGQYIQKTGAADYAVGWNTPSGAGDMLKSVYDTNDNGIVDNSEKLGGNTPDYYLPADALYGLTVSGASPITLTDVMDGTTITSVAVNGKSTQASTPDLSNPVPIVSIDADGVDVYPTGDQPSGETYPISPTLTLRGIPVPEGYGGNYTDSNGQEWVCDTYDIATGEYIQRVGFYALTGQEGSSAYSLETQGGRNLINFMTLPLPPVAIATNVVCHALCSHLATAGSVNQVVGNTGADFVIYIDSSSRNRARFAAPNTVSDKNAAIAWVQGQYTNGTPVTFAYILGTPVVSQLTPASVTAYTPSTDIDADGEVTAKYNSLYGMIDGVRQSLTASKQDVIEATGILQGNGGGNVVAVSMPTSKMLKTNSSGTITGATAGTDYMAPPSNVTGIGAVTVTLANNREYTYTGVTSLAITGAAVNAHGFITFAASAPTITSPSGFNGVSGDDITTAAASEIWEFSCASGYIVFKNWSAM